jgi:competence protein ComEA
MIKLKRFAVVVTVAVVVLSFGSLVAAQEQGKININSASVEKLTELKGIGAAYAQRIVEYREKHGSFKKPEDILKVQGIGAKTLEANADVIVVE